MQYKKTKESMKIILNTAFCPFLLLTTIHLLGEGFTWINYKFELRVLEFVWSVNYLLESKLSNSLKSFHSSQWGFIYNFHLLGEKSNILVLFSSQRKDLIPHFALLDRHCYPYLKLLFDD